MAPGRTPTCPRYPRSSLRLPMRLPPALSPAHLAGCALVAALASTGAARAAGSYEFVAAPAVDLNRIYRIDRATGEVTSCQYGLRDDSVGVTLCFAAGEGAGPQTPENTG